MDETAFEKFDRLYEAKRAELRPLVDAEIAEQERRRRDRRAAVTDRLRDVLVEASGTVLGASIVYLVGVVTGAIREASGATAVSGLLIVGYFVGWFSLGIYGHVAQKAAADLDTASAQLGLLEARKRRRDGGLDPMVEMTNRWLSGGRSPALVPRDPSRPNYWRPVRSDAKSDDTSQADQRVRNSDD